MSSRNLGNPDTSVDRLREIVEFRRLGTVESSEYPNAVAEIAGPEPEQSEPKTLAQPRRRSSRRTSQSGFLLGRGAFARKK